MTSYDRIGVVVVHSANPGFAAEIREVRGVQSAAYARRGRRAGASGAATRERYARVTASLLTPGAGKKRSEHACPPGGVAASDSASAHATGATVGKDRSINADLF